jgi:hypothetical protein
MVTRRYQSLTEAFKRQAYSLFNGPAVGLNIETKFEDFRMKKVLALVVAAAMGLSSAAFAADTAATAPAAAPAATHAAPAKTTHHKKHKKTAVEQKAQAAKKHHKKAATKPAVAQKAQAAKKHVKHTKHQAAKPAAQPAA